jgi:hypothetical protein
MLQTVPATVQVGEQLKGLMDKIQNNAELLIITHMVPLSDEQTPELWGYLAGYQQPHRYMCQSVPPKCKRKNSSESVTVP